jgi:hypothetical protein
LPDTFRAFEKDWPSSKNNKKLTKNTRIIKRLWTTSLQRWMKPWQNSTNFFE